VSRLIAELRRHSDRFAELWDAGAVGGVEGSRKTVDHPQVGALTLDCDVLSVAGSDLRIMVYTADPDSADAERLELVGVLGTQNLVS
jgi:transcription regulator MmyB-like protein